MTTICETRNLALADSYKQVFLALVSNHRTVQGRETGHYLSGENQIRAFMGLNEIQHQISGHIAGIGLGHEGYPDDVLWKILQEKAAAYGLTAHLGQSLEFAKSRDVWKQIL